jgi:hypothetical protein
MRNPLFIAETEGSIANKSMIAIGEKGYTKKRTLKIGELVISVPQPLHLAMLKHSRLPDQ